MELKSTAECVRFEKESFGALHQMLSVLAGIETAPEFRAAIGIVATVPALGFLLAAVAAWVNPYEQMMFHPFGEPRYVTIQQAGIDAKDMVIAVTLGGESRAYPIREMGYHHIVNDRLYQLPIVVTY